MAAGSDVDFEAELDRLYGLPLGEFTSARDELAKTLRAQGDADRAREVKKLRKPTVAVWLVNHLAHERQLDVQRLLKAGDALTKSQAAAGKPETFSEARRDERHALAQLAKAARELAGRESIGSSAVDRAIETLRAASVTEEGRELLRRGRLTEELEPPGFEALTGVAKPARKDAPAKTKPARGERAEKRQATQQARERVRQLRAEERELVKAARAAVREAERAEAEAVAARSRAVAAEERARGGSERREASEAEVKRLG